MLYGAGGMYIGGRYDQIGFFDNNWNTSLYYKQSILRRRTHTPRRRPKQRVVRRRRGPRVVRVTLDLVRKFVEQAYRGTRSSSARTYSKSGTRAHAVRRASTRASCVISIVR